METAYLLGQYRVRLGYTVHDLLVLRAGWGVKLAIYTFWGCTRRLCVIYTSQVDSGVCKTMLHGGGSPANQAQEKV